MEDEILIKAIQRMNDPDVEPERYEVDSDCSSVHEIAEAPMDADMQRLQDDMALRQHLGIGAAFTGPKGVIADKKFHAQQERARAAEKSQAYVDKISKSALSSGWMQRQIAAEMSSKTLNPEEEPEDDDFLQQYRKKRMQELAGKQTGPRFGNVVALNVDSFVQAIEEENADVIV
jgi:Phosducin